MKPREELINEVHDKMIAAHWAACGVMPDDDIKEALRISAADVGNNYAIGRLVSVEERLPELKENPHQHWKGLVMPINKKPLWITWYPDDDCEEITHWLDLSLPNTKGEA